MEYESLRFESHGVPFSARIVRTGERYGLQMALVHTKSEPMLEFYDARFDNEKFTPGLGQFISRYYAESIINIDNSPHRTQGRPRDGLTLDAGIWDWRIEGPDLDIVKNWARERLTEDLTAGVGPKP